MQLYTWLVLLIHTIGFVSLYVQYVDETKIEAASNQYRKSSEDNRFQIT